MKPMEFGFPEQFSKPVGQEIFDPPLEPIQGFDCWEY